MSPFRYSTVYIHRTYSTVQLSWEVAARNITICEYGEVSLPLTIKSLSPPSKGELRALLRHITPPYAPNAHANCIRRRSGPLPAPLEARGIARARHTILSLMTNGISALTSPYSLTDD